MPSEHQAAVEDFIARIPDHNLESFPDGETTLYKDINFRLDHQGLTKTQPISHQLFIQVNSSCRIKFLRTLTTRKGEDKLKAVCKIHVPKGDPWTPQELREALLATVNFNAGKPKKKGK